MFYEYAAPIGLLALGYSWDIRGVFGEYSRGIHMYRLCVGYVSVMYRLSIGTYSEVGGECRLFG